MSGMDGQPTTRGGPLYWLKRRSRWFWLCMAIVSPILYVASLGPACWIAGDNETSMAAVHYAYYPILRLARATRHEVQPGVFEIGRLDKWVESYSAWGRNDGAYPIQSRSAGMVWGVPPDPPDE